jgi:N-methylhydantoinase A
MTLRNPNLAFDVGGTFTDIVVLQSNGGLVVDKVLSNSDTIIASVRKHANDALMVSGHRELGTLLHATTAAANALLGGNGPVVGLLTTRGFRDELEMRRQSRPPIYDFFWDRPPPLVPRRRRLEVRERIDAVGDVVEPLNPDDAAHAILELQHQGIDALAICFLNSFANPLHERVAEDLARELLPASVMISASCDVSPQAREFERASTTVVNAYLLPVVGGYLDRMVAELSAHSSNFRIMQSNGGMMTAAYARRNPIQMIESGPAAGVLASAALAREVGLEGVVSFDMGGTTVKACLIEDGRPIERMDYEVGGSAHVTSRYSHGSGFAISVPSFDIVEMGAGGGSVARIEGGSLRVGPISAGAVPGPAAYGLGGTEPTVTDANVVLGFINPTQIAGGVVSIDAKAAERSIQTALGPAMGHSVRDMAYGVFQVANAAMVRSIRAVTTERGRDPRKYSLVAFGGSGPVHAVALAELLGIRKVYIPLFPGVFSAIGLLLADVRYDYSQSLQPAPLNSMSSTSLWAVFQPLDLRLKRQLEADGVDPGIVIKERFVDLRYSGQSSELTVPLPSEAAGDSVTPTLTEMFHAEHFTLYGYRQDSDPIVMVGARLTTHVPTRTTSMRDIGRAFLHAGDQVALTEMKRPVYFGQAIGERASAVLNRHSLKAGPREGPAIIEELTATVVVPPGWTAELDELANIILRPTEGLRASDSMGAPSFD